MQIQCTVLLMSIRTCTCYDIGLTIFSPTVQWLIGYVVSRQSCNAFL